MLLPYNAYYSNLEIGLISTWYVAMISYPDQFKDVTIEAKADEITKAFLGKEMYNEMKNHSTAYGGYQKLDLSTFVA